MNRKSTEETQMANRFLKRYSNSQGSTETQIKVRHHFIPHPTGQPWKALILDADVKELHTVMHNCRKNDLRAYRGSHMDVLGVIKVFIPDGPAILFLGMSHRETSCTSTEKLVL